jgi:type I restriction enzyme S subunit
VTDGIAGTVALGDHATFIAGFAFDSQRFNTDGRGLPIVRIRDVVRGHSATFYDGPVDPKFVVETGDYLIGMDGEFNVSVWRGGRAVLNQRVVKIASVSDRLDLGYLARFLALELKRIEAVTPSVTVKHLSMKTLRRVELPLPPLDEQQRIARALQVAESLQTLREEWLSRLAQLRQDMFHDLFGGAHSGAARWSTRPITEGCAVIVDCVNRTAPTSSGSTPFKMIRTTNVRGGKVDLTTVKYVDEATFARWNRRLTPVLGDVLLTREAPMGEAGILVSNDQVILGQRLMLYRVDPERLTPEYLLESFRSPFLQGQIARHGSGTTVKHLPLPACRSFEIVIPPVALQREFSARVQAINALEEKGLREASAMDALFASLQHRAFTGAR